MKLRKKKQSHSRSVTFEHIEVNIHLDYRKNGTVIQLCSFLRRGSHLSNSNGRLCSKKESKIVPCTIAYKLTPHGKSHQGVTMFAFTLLWSFCETIPSQ